MRKFLDIILVCLPLLGVSCIENDIPYPYTPLYVTSISGEGFTASISSVTRTVTLDVEETTDIENIVISEVVYSPEATSVEFSRDITSTLDMSYPVTLSLGVYNQTYLWSIEAVQDLQLSVSAVGQIGSADIDEENRRVYLRISDTQDPANITLSELKLAAEGITTYSPTVAELYDFSGEGNMRQVDVTSHGRKQTWQIYLTFEEAKVEMTLCSFLATMVWVETSGDTSTGEECGYLYRKEGDSDWMTHIVESPGNGSFSATITSLEPSTRYNIKSYIGDSESEVITRTTEGTSQLDNSDFELWHTDSWIRPYIYGDTNPVWDTGNQGASSGGATLTQNVTDPRTGSTGIYSAELDAQGVGILGYTKFAAGNIFTGSYVYTHNTDGVIAFGYPFTLRPIALRGWYKYTCGVIDYKGTNLSAEVDTAIEVGTTPDTGVIYIALGTWTPQSYTVSTITHPANEKSPVYVYTKDLSTFFDPKGDEVVAYGSLEKSESVSEWSEFYIPLDYYDKTTIPTHIIIVCSTSIYGDYFTGSSASKMLVDDLELVYE